MLGAPVPEASVNKDCNSKIAKHKIGFAGDLLFSSPTGDSVLPQEIKKCYFGAPIPSMSYARHHLGTLRRVEYIRHVFTLQVREKANWLAESLSVPHGAPPDRIEATICWKNPSEGLSGLPMSATRSRNLFPSSQLVSGRRVQA